VEEVVPLPTLAATRALAKRLAATMTPGSVLALVGDLGAGKTTFVQALAKALKVEQPREVLSPTYTLVNEYAIAAGSMLHLDLYRVTDSESAIALGLQDQMHRRDAIVVIEWADRFPELIPAGAQWLTLSVRDNRWREATVHSDLPHRLGDVVR
jgi:tRNA threonylcarbamoyladenosine biosynthesis protein TsaE